MRVVRHKRAYSFVYQTSEQCTPLVYFGRAVNGRRPALREEPNDELRADVAGVCVA